MNASENPLQTLSPASGQMLSRGVLDRCQLCRYHPFSDGGKPPPFTLFVSEPSEIPGA